MKSKKRCRARGLKGKTKKIKRVYCTKRRKVARNRGGVRLTKLRFIDD